MNKLLALVLTAACSFGATSVFAATDYNTPPAGNTQFSSCISYANKIYEGGTAASPVKGQSKAQAFCTCMWNETPDDFKGGLVKFSESPKGKATNEICEKHSDWGN